MGTVVQFPTDRASAARDEPERRTEDAEVVPFTDDQMVLARAILASGRKNGERRFMRTRRAPMAKVVPIGNRPRPTAPAIVGDTTPATVTNLPIDPIQLARAILANGREEFHAALKRLEQRQLQRFEMQVKRGEPGAVEALQKFREERARHAAFREYLDRPFTRRN